MVFSPSRRKLNTWLVAAAVGGAATGALADTAYPNKPVKPTFPK